MAEVWGQPPWVVERDIPKKWWDRYHADREAKIRARKKKDQADRLKAQHQKMIKGK